MDVMLPENIIVIQYHFDYQILVVLFSICSMVKINILVNGAIMNMNIGNNF